MCRATSGSFERQLAGTDLVRCAACGMVYVWPRPSRAESRASYERGERGLLSSAAAAADGALELWDSYAREYSALVQQALARQLHRIARGRAIRRMLDFGCGSGHFLALARRVLGCEIAGVEMHPVGKLGAERFGFMLHAGSLEDAPFPPDSFDLVHAGQVFEHLPEPLHELELLRRLLAPGGLVMIEVPNYASISIRLGRDRFTGNLPPGHLNYFTPATLQRLVRQASFDVVSSRTTGLNYRDILGLPPRRAPEARANAGPTEPDGAVPPGGVAESRRIQSRLRFLEAVDAVLSVLRWGVQNELVAVRPR